MTTMPLRWRVHRIVPALMLLAVLGAAHAEETALVVYPAFGDARGFVVEGRAIEQRAVPQSDHWWSNLWRNVRQLFNDEQKGVAVELRISARQWSTTTDAEGYFRVAAPADGFAAGWHEIAARSADGKAAGRGRLLIVPASNTLGIISDIDDTILVSQVTDRSRLLANTFLKSPHERQAVPGVADFYRRLVQRNPEPQTAAVIYLSASPRQLHANIQTFLDGNGFPRGVLITKMVTNDATSEPLADQFAYKTARIEDIFARLPLVKFVLVGDDGERDPEIYDAMQRRYPQRVQAVWIRKVSTDPGRTTFAGQQDLAKALATR